MKKIRRLPALLSLIAVSFLVYFSFITEFGDKLNGPTIQVIVKIVDIPVWIIWSIVFVLFSNGTEEISLNFFVISSIVFYILLALYFILIFVILYFIISYLTKVFFKNVK